MSELIISQERASALENAVLAVCSEAAVLLSGKCTASELRLRVQSCVSNLVTVSYEDFAKRLDKPPATSRLPAELLCHIFSCLDLRDKISTSHVCKNWRTISLAASSLLWSTITVRNFPAGSLRERLARARMAPVRLDILVELANVNEVADCLCQHLSHVRVLNLSIDTMDDTLTVDQDVALSRALACPAPILTTFVLFNPLHGFDFDPDDVELFGGCAPRLQRVKHLDISFPSPRWSALGSVRHLLLGTVERWTLTPDLGDLLPALPNLEALGLEVAGFSGLGAGEVVFPPSLSLFVLIINTMDVVFVPSERVRGIAQCAPQIKHFCVSFRSGTCSKKRVVDVLRLTAAYTSCRPFSSLAVARSLAASSSEDSAKAKDKVHLHLTNALGEQRTIHDIDLRDLPSSWLRNSTLFRNITRLSLFENCWKLLAPFPHMVHLEELEIHLVLPRGGGDSEPESVFALPMDSEQDYTLRCPSLRTLAISRCPIGMDGLQASAAAVIPPGDIIGLIQSRLWLDTVPVPQLVLRGIRLLESNITALAELVAMIGRLDLEDDMVPLFGKDHAVMHDLLTW